MIASVAPGMGSHDIFVQGVSVSTSWADANVSLVDLIFRGVSAALADARLSMSSVDSVVLSAHDLIDGRSLSSMVTAPAAGAYLRDEIRLTDDGLSALSLGVARLEAGESEVTLVAAWGRASEGDCQNVSRYGFDPFLVQPFGMDEFSVSALRMSRWNSGFPDSGARERAGDTRLRRAGANPRRHLGMTRPVLLRPPLRNAEAPMLADLVVAAVLAKTPTGVRIAGIGHGTDVSDIGVRDLLAMPALHSAARLASHAAGVALDRFDLYELDGATLTDEVLTLEALGLAAAGTGFARYADEVRFNPSGGSAAGWCHPTNGLVRFAEACLQMQGRAGAVQQAVRPRTALVTGLSPIAAQTAVAVALEAA